MKKFIIAATPIAGAAAVIAPIMASCSRHITSPVYFSNNEYKGEKFFGIVGNFNQDTNYEFTVDFSVWQQDYGKPTLDRWTSTSKAVIYFQKYDKSEVKIKNNSNIKVFCDGKELNRGTTEIFEAGNAPWAFRDSNIDPAILFNPKFSEIGYNSTLVIKNIQFEQDLNELLINVNQSW